MVRPDDDEDLVGAALLSEILHNLDEMSDDDADFHYLLKRKDTPYE